jgi:beta-lactamase class A
VDVVDDYNHVTIKLTNSGSATCSMRGFPGVDLKGRDGTTSAQRSQHTPSTVNLAPGQSAAFDLEVLQNNTGGSGVSFDQTVITPPNETHPQTMQLGFNLPVQADGNNTPAVIVNEITSAS